MQLALLLCCTSHNQSIDESLQVFWVAGHKADVISIEQVREPQMSDLDPSSWSSGLQMVMQTINEDAEQGGTERAALPEANGWALALPTLTTNPHGKQRAMI